MHCWIRLLTAATLGLTAPSVANTLRYHYDFTAQWNGSRWLGERWREPDMPMVPVVRARIALPYGEELASIRFDTGTEIDGGRAALPRAPRSRAMCAGEEHAALPALPAVFPADHLAPGSAEVLLHGYRFVQAAIFPQRIETASLRTWRVDAGDLVIETRAVTPSPLYRGLERDRAEVAALLADSDPADTRNARRQQAVLATYPRTRARATLDYLIVAPQAFIDDTEPDSLNRFLFEKNNKGVRTTTLAVETIRSRYPGNDLPAKIRAAITDYYRTRGIQYALLVGNGYSSVPTRKLTVALSDMTGSLPSDYYFACLDGDLSQTNPDLACEVAVGRAPVSTLDDLHVFVRKTELMHALEEDDPRLANELNFGEELDATTLGSALIDQLLTGGNAGTLSTIGYPTTAAARKMYETHRNTFSESEVVEAINSGQFYTINHVGHANEAFCMRINATDIPRLNNDIPFFAITQGCHPGNISVPNWASKLMNLPTGGAGAIIANSNFGFYSGQGSSDGPSNRFQLAFYDAYFRDGLKNLGKLHFQAKQKIAPQVQEDRTMLWVIYETNLLGDPELELKLPRH